MTDTEKTQKQLFDELHQLRRQVQEFAQREEACRQQKQIIEQQFIQEKIARIQTEQHHPQPKLCK